MTREELIQQLKDLYPWTKEAAEMWERDLELMKKVIIDLEDIACPRWRRDSLKETLFRCPHCDCPDIANQTLHKIKEGGCPR